MIAEPALQGRDRGGFALLTVLWLITALSAIVGLSMASTRLGNQASANRIVLARGRWAAEACLAIVQARWAQQRLPDTATIDLGRGLHCGWNVLDPTARVNFNTADRDMLQALGLSEAFVRAVLEHRRQAPFEDLAQVVELPDFDSVAARVGTVIGPGSVNLSAALGAVLRALPGLTPEAVDRILYRRRVGRPVASLDELAAELSPPGRAALMNRYADLARLVTFTAPQLVLRAEGWIEELAPRATIELVVVPLPERLAVVGRRMW
ncbi:MAG: type II secretion system protein GspK [Gemmatimonadales bacterium]